MSMTINTTLRESPRGTAVEYVFFRSIRLGVNTRLAVEDAAAFWLRNYATHEISKFQWAGDNEPATYAHARWYANHDSRITRVIFQDPSGSVWVSAEFSEPIGLWEKDRLIGSIQTCKVA